MVKVVFPLSSSPHIRKKEMKRKTFTWINENKLSNGEGLKQIPSAGRRMTPIISQEQNTVQAPSAASLQDPVSSATPSHLPPGFHCAPGSSIQEGVGLPCASNLLAPQHIFQQPWFSSQYPVTIFPRKFYFTQRTVTHGDMSDMRLTVWLELLRCNLNSDSHSLANWESLPHFNIRLLTRGISKPSSKKRAKWAPLLIKVMTLS